MASLFMSFLKAGAFNLFFRILALGAKFFIVIYITNRMSLESLGYYGLIATIIVFFLQVLGADFYLFSTREILGANNAKDGQFIKDQGVFHLLSYIVAIPVAAIIFSNYKSFSGLVVFALTLLVVSEHFSQELSRLYVTLKRPIFSNFIYFIRAGSWIYLFILVSFFDQTFLSVETLIFFWLAASYGSVLVGLAGLWKLFKSRASILVKTDFTWVKKGLLVASPFLVSTIFLQLIEVSDRFFIDYFYSETEVGIYVFSQNIANLLNTLINTGIVAVLAPRLVFAALNDKGDEYRKLRNRFKLSVMIVGLVLVIVLMIGYPFVLVYTDQIELQNSLAVFYLLVISVYLGILALIPYYDLYINNYDMELLKSIGVAAIANIILNFMLVPKYGAVGAATSSLIAYSLMFLIRLLYTKRIPSIGLES